MNLLFFSVPVLGTVSFYSQGSMRINYFCCATDFRFGYKKTPLFRMGSVIQFGGYLIHILSDTFYTIVYDFNQLVKVDTLRFVYLSKVSIKIVYVVGVIPT